MVTVHSAITPRGISDLAALAVSSVSAVAIVFSLFTRPYCTELEAARSLFVVMPLAGLSDLLANPADIDVRNIHREAVLIENRDDILPIRVDVVQSPLIDTELPDRLLAELGEARPL